MSFRVSNLYWNNFFNAIHEEPKQLCFSLRIGGFAGIREVREASTLNRARVARYCGASAWRCARSALSVPRCGPRTPILWVVMGAAAISTYAGALLIVTDPALRGIWKYGARRGYRRIGSAVAGHGVDRAGRLASDLGRVRRDVLAATAAGF
jgi:hypothetical protein